MKSHANEVAVTVSTPVLRVVGKIPADGHVAKPKVAKLRLGNTAPKPKRGTKRVLPADIQQQQPVALLLEPASPLPWVESPLSGDTFEPATPLGEMYNNNDSLVQLLPPIADIMDSTGLLLLKFVRTYYNLVEPDGILGDLALSYRKTFESLFRTPLQEIYDRAFFSPSAMVNLPLDSPILFAAFSIIGTTNFFGVIFYALCNNCNRNCCTE